MVEWNLAEQAHVSIWNNNKIGNRNFRYKKSVGLASRQPDTHTITHSRSSSFTHTHTRWLVVVDGSSDDESYSYHYHNVRVQDFSQVTEEMTTSAAARITRGDGVEEVEFSATGIVWLTGTFDRREACVYLRAYWTTNDP